MIIKKDSFNYIKQSIEFVICSFNTNCSGYLKVLYSKHKYLRAQISKETICVCFILLPELYLVMFFKLICAFTNSVPCRKPISSWSPKVKFLQNLMSSPTLKSDIPPLVAVFSSLWFTVPVGQFCKSAWASPPSCDSTQAIDGKSS